AAGRCLLDFIHQSQPDVELHETGPETITHAATGTEFRRLHSDVFIATTSVTSRQFAHFSAAAGLHVPPVTRWNLTNDAPAVCVTWFEAMACCYWLGGVLPSEVEWKYAASAGQNLEYSTNTGQIGHNQAHYGHVFASGHPQPQTQHPANAAGYFGMCGNTWDWCLDSWGNHRVIRGGCWMDSEQFCRVSARYRNAPVDRDCAVGFRVRVRARR